MRVKILREYAVPYGDGVEFKKPVYFDTLEAAIAAVEKNFQVSWEKTEGRLVGVVNDDDPLRDLAFDKYHVIVEECDNDGN